MRVEHERFLLIYDNKAADNIQICHEVNEHLKKLKQLHCVTLSFQDERTRFKCLIIIIYFLSYLMVTGGKGGSG